VKTVLAASDLSSEWMRPDVGVVGVEILSTTRLGGVSSGCYEGLNLGDHVLDDPECVRENRARLAAQLPDETAITWLTQVHGSRVIYAPADYALGVQADAVWTDTRGWACAIMTADCLPIVLADQDGRCVAAIHGGWRSLADQIIEKTIEALPVVPSSLVAWLGPAIGPSAFEVGGDVLAAFYLSEQDLSVHAIPGTPEKYFLDLNIVAGRQLLALGLQPENITGGDRCTFLDARRFYSYRRDKQTGRMATLIYFK
jgi:YfiH family protein